MDFSTTPLIHLLRYEEKWCKHMDYFNPYIDPFKVWLTNTVPSYDGGAYKKYPQHRYVYDKLWICLSQGLRGGKLENLKYKDVEYPIFIKPRWGHKSASSKNCFKIDTPEELQPYLNYKEMIWSEYLDAREGMTDYIMVHGTIVYQLTYIYSDKQNGFIDNWKYISPESKAPSNITEWVQNHMHGFTGVVNVQYRANKIIEVGLRFARGGAYLHSTNNQVLIRNINSAIDQQYWDHSLGDKLSFTPFYSFKCFITAPVLYLLPQKIIDILMKSNNAKSFYEYYFEPAGKDGLVVFQFMHNDYEDGMKLKTRLETIFSFIQYFFIVGFILVVILILLNRKVGKIVLIVLLVLLFTRFLNPLTAQYGLYKVQKLALFGHGPPKDMELSPEILGEST